MLVMIQGPKACGQEAIWYGMYMLCSLGSLPPLISHFSVTYAQPSFISIAAESLAYSQWPACNHCPGGKTDAKLEVLSISQVTTFVVNKISEFVRDAVLAQLLHSKFSVQSHLPVSRARCYLRERKCPIAHLYLEEGIDIDIDNIDDRNDIDIAIDISSFITMLAFQRI